MKYLRAAAEFVMVTLVAREVFLKLDRHAYRKAYVNGYEQACWDRARREYANIRTVK